MSIVRKAILVALGLSSLFPAASLASLGDSPRSTVEADTSVARALLAFNTANGPEAQKSALKAFIAALEKKDGRVASAFKGLSELDQKRTLLLRKHNRQIAVLCAAPGDRVIIEITPEFGNSGTSITVPMEKMGETLCNLQRENPGSVVRMRNAAS